MGLIIAILMIVGSILASAISRLLADEGKAWLPRLIERLVQRAVSKLPLEQQERFAEEWRAHLNEVPGDISKLLCAVGFQELSRRGWCNYAADALIALLLITILSPSFLAIGIWIKLESPGPIFIPIEGLDNDGRLLRGLMFRPIARKDGKVYTACDGCDDLSDDDMEALYRVTQSGKLLYRTGMSGLPILFSVLRGRVRMRALISRGNVRTLLNMLLHDKRV